MTDKKNPFNLYEEGLTKEELKKSKKATKEFIELWQEFAKKWRELQDKYTKQGASDTAAREDMARWIKEQTEGPMWCDEEDYEKLNDIEHEVYDTGVEQRTIREQSYIDRIADLHRQLDFWIERAKEGGTIGSDGICGFSSTNLALVASGIRETPNPDAYPRDDGDWGRCKRTIERIYDLDWLLRILKVFAKRDEWKKYREKLVVSVNNQITKVVLMDE
jgi:hypothetical protein